ncbi:hypothetical protein [Dyella humicola]|uniref:hypothetical protein n=1 Tax=Dyella humicola TaxID=2992126 RepID=UPI002253255F|nr:hypothetical protein [Dyella humicola]
MIVPIPNIIIFQYNPESLSRTIEPYQLPDSKAAGPDKAVTTAPTTTQPKPPVEKFTLTLQLDASDALEVPDLHPVAVVSGVADRLAALEMLLYAEDSKGLGFSLSLPVGGSLSPAGTPEAAAQAQPVPKGKSPTILFVWGPGRIVPVRINTFNVDEQLCNPMLYPLRAKVSLGMQVLTDDDFGSTPDTIEKLAGACYKFTMTQKRVLALANVANDVESILGLLPI